MFSTTGSVKTMLGRKIKNGKNSSSTSIDGTPLDYQIPGLSYHKSNTFPRDSSTPEGPLNPVSALPSSRLTSTYSHKPPPLSLHNQREVRPSASKASLSGRDARPRSPGLTPSHRSSPLGLFPPTPTLPPKWSSVHDRAICVLDACDYSLNATVRKMRSAFPELAGSVLTPIMIDKRLRTLDQNVDLDFFRIGFDHLLLPGDGDDDEKTKLSKAESKQTTSVESRYTTPSMPSFSSVSSDRQNSDISVGRSLKHDQVLTTPESDGSGSSSSPSKNTRVNKGVVRSYPFDTGYMSVLTTSGQEEAPRRNSGLTDLVKDD